MLNRFLGFLALYFFNDMVLFIGDYGLYWFFAGFNVIGVLYIYWNVPETKGKTLQEIQDLLASKEKFKIKSKSVP